MPGRGNAPPLCRLRVLPVVLHSTAWCSPTCTRTTPFAAHCNISCTLGSLQAASLCPHTALQAVQQRQGWAALGGVLRWSLSGARVHSRTAVDLAGSPRARALRSQMSPAWAPHPAALTFPTLVALLMAVATPGSTKRACHLTCARRSRRLLQEAGHLDHLARQGRRLACATMRHACVALLCLALAAGCAAQGEVEAGLPAWAACESAFPQPV